MLIEIYLNIKFKILKYYFNNLLILLNILKKNVITNTIILKLK